MLGRGALGALPALLVKFNSEGRDRTATCAKFEEYLALAGELNVGECLLVSGSGPRAFDSLALLEALGGAASKRPAIGVAFNPFLTDQMSERSRLRRKLATGHVSSVWLQLGSDVEQLETPSPSSASSSASASCNCASTARSSCRRASCWRR